MRLGSVCQQDCLVPEVAAQSEGCLCRAADKVIATKGNIEDQGDWYLLCVTLEQSMELNIFKYAILFTVLINTIK